MKFTLRSLFKLHWYVAAAAVAYNGYCHIPRYPAKIVCESLAVTRPGGQSSIVLAVTDHDASIWVTNQDNAKREHGMVGLNAVDGQGAVWVSDGKGGPYQVAITSGLWNGTVQMQMVSTDGTAIVHVTPAMMAELEKLIPPPVPVAPRD